MDYLSVVNVIANIATACVAIAAYRYTIKQYRLHKEEEKAHAISLFNSRYANDDYISPVQIDIMCIIDNVLAGNNSAIEFKSSERDRELFLRFFEELQISIEKHRLNENEVYDMFSYYGVVASFVKERMIVDYRPSEWRYYERFVRKMMDIDRSEKHFEFDDLSSRFKTVFPG